MNIIFGILNWTRQLDSSYEQLQTLGKVILCSDKTYLQEPPNTTTICADPSVAASKNKIIQKARELGGDYLFLIEDDVTIVNPEVFNLYIAKMQKYNLGTIFYGFHESHSRVCGGVPNPCSIVRTSATEEEYIVRTPCDAVIGIDLKTNNLLFDERVQRLEFTEYIVRVKKANLIPFNGFFIDIPKSWEYFGRTDVPNIRTIDREILTADSKYLTEQKIENNLDSDINQILKYLAEKNGMQYNPQPQQPQGA